MNRLTERDEYGNADIIGVDSEDFQTMAEIIRFMLDGCDISFVASAPADITLRQLLTQCDKIKPDWCACGIRSLNKSGMQLPDEIEISYDSIRKTSDSVPCTISEVNDNG